MNTSENQSINYEDLKKELTALSFADLKERFNTLGITHVWKGGVKKEVLINAGIEDLRQRKGPVEPEDTIPGNPIVETPVTKDQPTVKFEFSEGETVLEEKHFEQVPGLKEAGFEIGDTLISIPGQPLSKKISPEDAEKLLEEERLQKVIDRAKELGIETDGLEEDDLYEAILDVEASLEPQDPDPLVQDPEDDEDPNPLLKTEEVEDVIEIEEIDEDKFTEEEILENIEITQANLYQALPATRNFLLKKGEALEAALSRKRSK